MERLEHEIRDRLAAEARHQLPSPLTPLKLAPRLRAIVEQEYPRFSRAEYERRHKALAQVMEKAKVDSLLVVTENRSGNAPQWVTGWPGTVQAYVVFKPGEQMWMSVEWFNHFPACEEDRVRRGGALGRAPGVAEDDRRAEAARGEARGRHRAAGRRRVPPARGLLQADTAQRRVHPAAHDQVGGGDRLVEARRRDERRGARRAARRDRARHDGARARGAGGKRLRQARRRRR